LQPIPRAYRELTLERTHRILAHMPARDGRTRVIVTLGLPPLAQTDLARAAGWRKSGFAARKLNMSSASARVYVARLDAAQRRAIASLKRAIPQAQISRRFRVILDGITVSVPTTKMAALDKLDFVQKVYPSFRYTLHTNRSGSLIGVPQLRAATGLRGDGVKVAVVDDGIDERNPFFVGTGLSMPAGFPKGNTQFTSSKVIVARSFTGKGATREARLPLDPNVSFHGTHVAGVIGGKENTTAPDSTVISEEQTPKLCVRSAGGCIPRVDGLTGVAPRAWLGNYRVFSVPDPLTKSDCCVANTPEIIAAFEAAVADGMDVINFSGGGSQADPEKDAMIPAVANTARAGVVPVISAGNDRELFGLGTVGSPSTAPDAISVAAVTNAHVFTPVLQAISPSLGPIGYFAAPGVTPAAWGTTDQTLVDVGTIAGTDGRPVDRSLCGNNLPGRSLLNVIALVNRGGCDFRLKGSKASAAGAEGVVVVDDNPGEASGIAVGMTRPAGMIADLDGGRLRAAMASSGGRATVRIGRDINEVLTGRGGTPAAFSSAGLTAFGHELKPDVSAPGTSILSSTVDDFAGSNYAVLDGTSFSAPHVAGAAALLLERNPGWTPKQVKSALMSTAGPSFADTAQTSEASVLLEGAGLVSLPDAVNPKIFTDPQSLSFRYLNVTAGGASRSILVQVADAGGGAGTWQVGLQPQAATAGASIGVPSTVSVSSGGTTTLEVVASASGGATAGDNYGFVVLTQGGARRRIPYAFLVDRPALAGSQPVELKNPQTGDTRNGVDRAHAYRWPNSPFGLTGLLGVDAPLDETGKEQVYYIDVTGRPANVGVTVVSPPYNVNAPFEDLLIAGVHPWFMSSLDENDVTGIAGTPINSNSYMDGFLLDSRTAGTAFPRPGRYYVSVESGSDDPFGSGYSGPYVLRSWINDTKRPKVTLLTKRVSAGKPSIALRVTDTQSGVDPFAVLLDFGFVLTGASQFDPATGIAVIPLPRTAPRLKPGRTTMRLIASDLQEAKNVNTDSEDLLPNTARKTVRIRVVNQPTATWLTPRAGSCVRGTTELSVVAASPSAVSSVAFFVGSRQIARTNKNAGGVYSVNWNSASAKKGNKTLLVVVSDSAGREARVQRRIRVC
jgi:minor extracellular serine protease Vpr